MQRLYDFLRRHPTWVDSFWAVVLLGISGVSLTNLNGAADQQASLAAALPIAVVLSAVVALRRLMPEKMLVLAAVAGFAQVVLDVPPAPADFAMMVIIYTVAADGDRWASRMGLIGGLCAATVGQLRWPVRDQGPLGAVLIVVFQTVPFALAWVLGDSIRTRRAYLAQLEERAARLEKEREAQAKVAVAAERARIARELHDVVAHNVSVMVVQADGAAYVMDAAPDQAKKALETISGTGRQALAEMRRLLGVLRTGEHQESGEYVPQPDVEQLDDLIEQCRTSGLPVDFKVEGTPRPLPSGVELTAYRIVQEALTNTRKHGERTPARACAWSTSTTASDCSSRTTARARPTSCTRRGRRRAGPRPDRHAGARRHGRRHSGRGAAARWRLPHQCPAPAQARPLTPVTTTFDHF